MITNVAGLLWNAARAHPDRPAIIDAGSVTDHQTLAHRAGDISAALGARGVAPGDRVGILLDRGAEAAAAFFGILASGGVAVIVNEALRPRQIEHILADAGARWLVTDPAILGRLPRALQVSATLLGIAELQADTHGPVEPIDRVATDLAQIVYTSGSTGAPKGVMIGHTNLLAVAASVVEYLEITPTDRIAGLMTLATVYGMNQLLCAVATGASLVVDRAILPHEIVAGLRDGEVTVVAGVPPLWLRLLKDGGLRDAELPAMRVMTNAGGHLPVEAVRALRAAHPRAALFLMYGLTEVLRSTYLAPDEVDRHPDSIGRAIPGAAVWIVDELDRIVPPGMVGELVHRGPTVTLGYWNDPALTAQIFRPLDGVTHGEERAVRSGDLVRQDESGRLYFVSRVDRIIKSMGFRVGPDEIVDAMMASGEVAAAEVVGVPDGIWGTRIIAHLVLAEGGTLPRVKEWCGRELPRHMQPAHYQVHAALPLLPSGKHDYSALSVLPAPS